MSPSPAPSPSTPAVTAPLAGKRALVTGGARGIGAAIVRRLASDGAAVAFTYSASADAANALASSLNCAMLCQTLPADIRASSVKCPPRSIWALSERTSG